MKSQKGSKVQSKVLVTSNSNVRFLNSYLTVKFDDVVIVNEPPKRVWHKRKSAEIWALGGGSVIDTAKMMAGDRSCVAIPTTASGASVTPWSVVWKPQKKVSVLTVQPVLCELYRKLPLTLPEKVVTETYFDCLAHILDSRSSKDATHESLSFSDLARILLARYEANKNVYDLIDAGNYAGRAIAITGTGYYHAMSYVLTLDHGLSHGMALKAVIEMDKRFDWNKVSEKAKKYNKFRNRTDYA